MNDNHFKLFMFVTKSTSGWLPLQNMVAYHIYGIVARNSHIGIWVPEIKGFIIRREKLGRIYIFHELHWDVGEPNGTAKPFIDYGKIPDNLISHCEKPDKNDQQLISYLEEFENTHNFEDQLNLIQEILTRDNH